MAELLYMATSRGKNTDAGDAGPLQRRTAALAVACEVNGKGALLRPESFIVPFVALFISVHPDCLIAVLNLTHLDKYHSLPMPSQARDRSVSNDVDGVSLLTYLVYCTLTIVLSPRPRTPTPTPTSQTCSTETAMVHQQANQAGRRIQSMSLGPSSSYAVVIMLTTALIVAQQQHVVIRTVLPNESFV